MKRSVLWSHLGQPGLEHLFLHAREEEVLADGQAITMEQGMPLRAHYVVRCNSDWQVTQFDIDILGRLQADLHLRADGKGNWFFAEGEPIPDLAGCIDIDISISPFTNTLPIRRLQLAVDESKEILVAYVALPDMQVTPIRQRYTCLSDLPGERVYRYESLDSEFSTEITIDDDGLVINYPHLFEQLSVC
ncbi:putative glycolipid-binding domain-containing protein [Ktedonobacter racemifer]|uniref:Uncharacterized protein n=1 Tax=Ktedonobacter racemifer DSM 44963 TaxID=485913 RepID=D6THI3_KTERA|nr:putative glycolipid-binding domain-containing protein [Ktedonobacter racemifer]EFH88988.1 protein of unknown function DUF1089 [Ktedonobacter racemifer DSM 44963]